ncbi:peptidase C48, SUMO/sentrin/Ubl1, partial [Tanacetum coccineum]
FEKYFVENEHLFVPTEPSAEKKKDEINDDDVGSFFNDDEENIKKGRAWTAEIRKKSAGRTRTTKKREEIFNDGERMILIKINIQTLAPGLEIDTSVIDAYASIPSYEEKFKMMNMKRHFFYTSMMMPGILEDKTKEIDKKIDAQYDKFHEMISIQMQNKVEKMQMQELAFFPIIAHGHYYLIFFNLKTGKAVIIDNSDSDATYEGKYKENVDFVINNLRSRIAAKRLLHEVNDLKKKMSDYATKMTGAGEEGSNQQ